MAFTYPPSSGGGGGASNLDDLTDVVLGTPVDGQVLTYNGTEWVNANPHKIIVPASNPYGYYSPKGIKNDAFNWWDPNNVNGFEIEFDKTMYFTKFAVLVKNFPEGWTGGALKVWVWNSDVTTGLPTTILQELGTLTVPASNPAPMPFMAALIETDISGGGILLNANTRYWVSTSNGTGSYPYGQGQGPDLAQVIVTDGVVNNYPVNNGDGLRFQGADNGNLFFGTLQDAGGINAGTLPANAGAMLEWLQPTQTAPLVFFKGGLD